MPKAEVGENSNNRRKLGPSRSDLVTVHGVSFLILVKQGLQTILQKSQVTPLCLLGKK